MMSLNDVPKRILDVPIWTAGHKDFELVRTLRIFITSKTLQVARWKSSVLLPRTHPKRPRQKLFAHILDPEQYCE
jgi:hypothetical protein